MNNKKKNLSSPFATGSGGAHFEAHIQASFVTLMLTGGYAPILPCWPIVEVKLQGKIDGYDTDDLIVFVQNQETNEKVKLLCQVKHTIKFIISSSILTEVMEGAWNDYNNPAIFTKNKDRIALITGPLAEVDFKNISWILNQARHTKDAREFYNNVTTAKFSPSKSEEKLGVIRHHLKIANNDKDVSDDLLYSFLKHFHLIGYDLGTELGVVLSLLHSHISQFNSDQPNWLFSHIVNHVQTWNQSAGTITLDNLPPDIKDAFKQKTVGSIPTELAIPANPKPILNWSTHKKVESLTLATMIGAWDENNQSDIDAIRDLIDEL